MNNRAGEGGRAREIRERGSEDGRREEMEGSKKEGEGEGRG